MNMYDNIGSEIVREKRDTIARQVMFRTYFYMIGVTILSGISACISYSSGYFEQIMNSNLWWIFFAVELAVILICSMAASSNNAILAGSMLIVYSVVNGVTLAYVFAMYDLTSVLAMFFVAAGMFAALAFYGTVTKRSLSTIGTVCYMGLIGIILLTLANIFFLKSSGLDFGLSIAGLGLFIGITIYDTQKIKDLALQADEKSITSLAIVGALNLYLDFINIFVRLLDLFGDR